MNCSELRKLVLYFLCMTAAIASCQTSNTRDDDSSVVHPGQWATFNGDMPLAGDAKDFYRRYRISALDGHNLYQRQKARVKDQRINCLLRDCRLHPGQHSIEIEYLWTSLETEKKKNRTETREAFGWLFVLLGGQPGNLNDHSRFYPCQASLTFEVYADRGYGLRIPHTDRYVRPEEIQVVDIDSDAVVGSANPSCSPFQPTASPEE